MRIGIVVDKFPSVSETFILNKVEGLAERGYSIVVFRNSRHNNAELERRMLRRHPGITSVDMTLPTNPLEATRRLLMQPSVAVSAFRSSSSSLRKNIISAIRDEYFAANPCDIYHFEFSGLALQYLPLIKALKGKTVVSCRGSAEKVKPITQQGRKEELQQLFKVIDKIHCVSKDMAATVEQLGAPADKVFVNRPAIHKSVFTPVVDKQKTSTVNIISVGRLTFQKGYLPGLIAMKKVVSQYPSVHWKIVGDGSAKEEVMFYIHDLGLQSHVTLTGSMSKEEIVQLYQQADIFFLPSVYEGIANVVLEAMAMELPVVSSNCSGMTEVITHGVNGLLAENYHSEQMADAILQLIDDNEFATQIGKAAGKRIQEDFDIERQLDVFAKEYQQLLSPVTA